MRIQYIYMYDVCFKRKQNSHWTYPSHVMWCTPMYWIHNIGTQLWIVTEGGRDAVVHAVCRATVAYLDDYLAISARDLHHYQLLSASIRHNFGALYCSPLSFTLFFSTTQQWIWIVLSIIVLGLNVNVFHLFLSLIRIKSTHSKYVRVATSYYDTTVKAYIRVSYVVYECLS